MDSPLVSIIIPVYNTAPWLAECLDSVVGQDYQELQIICVNDGSTDGSLKIIENYAARDKRILLIDQENCGVAAARNVGIRKADGKYLFFLDSDDKLYPDIFHSLVQRAESDALEILRFSSDFFYEGENLKTVVQGYRSRYDYPGIYSGPEFYTAQASQKDYTVVVWRSIHLRKFLIENDITFYYSPYEDNLFMFQCYILAGRVGFLQKKCILHRFRVGSIMTSQPTIKNVRAYYIAANKIEQLCFENRKKLANYPACFQRASVEMNCALRIYCKDPETFRAQAVDPFDKAMLKELDHYAGLDKPKLSPKRETELLQAIADREAQLRAAEKGYQKELRQKDVVSQKALAERDAQWSKVEKEYQKKLSQGDKAIQKAYAALDAVYDSLSWKVGNFIVRPLHKIFQNKKGSADG